MAKCKALTGSAVKGLTMNKKLRCFRETARRSVVRVSMLMDNSEIVAFVCRRVDSDA